ncbi:hypothetical protein PRIPAC_82706 [Pristionchus pacificus]|uniref:Uncharacterized protein n=1 Tax=Pristionchus pacificus TaxID=54126 RepID=A0A2A6CMN7_PRIPA|nr:hypothetical protein PRIPAC_82706 [Pristionchus pacificus]|eukprot:PDM79291.1 hypothetical protein PRIPAC_31870 [Pristionchus pacificus]
MSRNESDLRSTLAQEFVTLAQESLLSFSSSSHSSPHRALFTLPSATLIASKGKITQFPPREREGRGRRRDEGTEVRSARDTVVTEVIPAKGIRMTDILRIYD